MVDVRSRFNKKNVLPEELIGEMGVLNVLSRMFGKEQLVGSLVLIVDNTKGSFSVNRWIHFLEVRVSGGSLVVSNQFFGNPCGKLRSDGWLVVTWKGGV